jgi:hypothetical protein
VYAGDIPSVKAWDGPLPDGIAGTEFYTDVEPVITIERKQLVAIAVVISRQVSREQADASSETK